MAKSYEEMVAEAREATEQMNVEEVHGVSQSGFITVVDVREPEKWGRATGGRPNTEEEAHPMWRAGAAGG